MTNESTAAKKNVDGGREDRLISFTDEEKKILRRTVCKNASDDEFKVFLHVAETYGLNPFLGQIFYWKDKKGNSIQYTSRDGYLSIANRHEAFDGFFSDVVRKNDSFKRKNDVIEHEYGTDRGEIIGAFCQVFRKDRSQEVYSFANFNEYNGYNSVWNRYPSAMILKVAESMALKRAFSVSGLVSKEEMDVQMLEDKEKKRTNSHQDKVIKSADEKEQEKADSKSKSNKVKKLTGREKEIKSIVDGNIKLRKDLFEYLEHVKKMKGVDKISINDLTNKEYSELYHILQSFKRIDSKNKSA